MLLESIVPPERGSQSIRGGSGQVSRKGRGLRGLEEWVNFGQREGETESQWGGHRSRGK